MVIGGKALQLCLFVVGLQIGKKADHHLLLPGGVRRVDGVGAVQKVHEQQSHRLLQKELFVSRLVEHEIDQVFDKVLDGEDIVHRKKEVVASHVPAGKAADHKVPQRTCPVIDHRKNFVKEGGKNQEVHRNVVLTRRQHLLRCMLVHEQEIPLL